MPSNSNIESLAKISQYLWADTVSKETSLFGGTIDPRKPMQLYMEAKALQYGLDESLDGLDGVGNYVYAMCGAKLNQASVILQAGTSGGDVITGGGGYGVREYSNFGSVGQVDIVFSEAIGTTLLSASRGGVEAGTIITSGTPVDNQVKWDKATGTLTFVIPFGSSDFVRILVK